MSATDDTKDAAKAASAALTPDGLRQPRVDTSAVEAALGKYLASYGEAPRPLRWFDDPDAARRFIRSHRMHRAYASASAARLVHMFDAAWDMVVPPPAPMPSHTRVVGRTRITYGMMGDDWDEVPQRFLHLLQRLDPSDDPLIAGLHAPVPTWRTRHGPAWSRRSRQGCFASA